MTIYLRGLASLLSLLAVSGAAQTHIDTHLDPKSDLRYVVYLSRHGVRSPTGKASQYDPYSNGSWPEWIVQPGFLTPHGFHLMELFGAYDRSLLAHQGLLQPSGCSDASHITVYADSDQRTRETGKALARGLMPGCELPVQGLPEGTNDPLFHALGGASAQADAALATAAVSGRLGGSPENLTRAYKPQLEALDHILACVKAQPSKAPRTSLFDIPAKLSQGSGDHLVDLKGPLNTASTLAENLLLEYTEGMDTSDVAWGCADPDDIAAAISLHAAATDYTQRTPVIGRAQAYNLLSGIRKSLQQAVEGKRVPGALGEPNDRVLILVGHDTNQENIAGLLGLNWIVDGRRDDTPPGGALVFELWRNRETKTYTVRIYFTAQTLEQMRRSIPLTSSQPPDRVPVFIPGCSGADLSCSLQNFSSLLQR
jgi:4-phytase / acid phosphatase